MRISKVFIILLGLACLIGQTTFAKEVPAGEEPAEQTEHTTEPYENDPEMDCTKNIRYSVGQKKLLDQLYHRIYIDYINLIEAYTYAGALTQEQKDLRYKMVKNYINVFYQRNYRWCSEHEPDEWEEEWYNND